MLIAYVVIEKCSFYKLDFQWSLKSHPIFDVNKKKHKNIYFSFYVEISGTWYKFNEDKQVELIRGTAKVYMHVKVI